MEAPGLILQRQKKRSKWLWIGIACAVFAAIIVIVVPCAVILTRKHSHPKGIASNVLVPLYVYPQNGAWDPVYNAVKSRPELNFTIVINPDSGPGSTQYPNSDYASAVRKINAYENVRTVGYVRTAYATRNISMVMEDVATYSGWATNSTTNSNDTGLAVHGIFFDEAPHEYTAAAATYMDTINQAVLDASGILANKTIIHNPGTIPDAGLDSNSTSVTVVFENSYTAWQSDESALSDLSLSRSSYSYLMYAVPSGQDLDDLVNSMSQHAGYLFATNLNANYYESFGSDWQSFIQAVPS